MNRPVAVDFFAGVGGMSLGFEQAGFDIVASIEYDPVHAAVHAFNFPLTNVVCAPVETLTEGNLMRAIDVGFEKHGRERRRSQEIDVVFGGPPCQGFSFIGRRQLTDERNNLVLRFAELITMLRPRYFVMENVPGIAAGRHRLYLDEFIRAVEVYGYKIGHCGILNAAEFAVPQDRRRFIVIGSRRDQPSISVIPALCHAVRNRRPEPSLLDTGPTVRDAIGSLPNADEYPELLQRDWVELTARDRVLQESNASDYERIMMGIERDVLDLSYRRRVERAILTSSMRTVHTADSTARFAATKQGEVEPVSRFFRLSWSGLSNTLRAGSGSERGAFTSPRPIHPEHHRVITVREAARLHSFPDWFRFHVTKWNGFRQIGNAVPPRLARAIGRELVAAMGIAIAQPTRTLTPGSEKLLSLSRLSAAQDFGVNVQAIPASRARLVAI